MDVDATTALTAVTGAVGTVGTAVTALWRWIARQLEECKAEHRESRERIEELHNDIKQVSETVGELKGRLSVYGRKYATEHENHTQHGMQGDKSTATSVAQPDTP